MYPLELLNVEGERRGGKGFDSDWSLWACLVVHSLNIVHIHDIDQDAFLAQDLSMSWVVPGCSRLLVNNLFSLFMRKHQVHVFPTNADLDRRGVS